VCNITGWKGEREDFFICIMQQTVETVKTGGTNTPRFIICDPASELKCTDWFIDMDMSGQCYRCEVKISYTFKLGIVVSIFSSVFCLSRERSRNKIQVLPRS